MTKTFQNHTNKDKAIGNFIVNFSLDDPTVGRRDMVIMYQPSNFFPDETEHVLSDGRKVAVEWGDNGGTITLYVEPTSRYFLLDVDDDIYFSNTKMKVIRVTPTQVTVNGWKNRPIRFHRKDGRAIAPHDGKLSFGDNAKQRYIAQKIMSLAYERQTEIAQSVRMLSQEQTEYIYRTLVGWDIIDMPEQPLLQGDSETDRVLNNARKGQNVYVLDAVDDAYAIYMMPVKYIWRQGEYPVISFYPEKTNVFVGDTNMFFDGKYTFMAMETDDPYVVARDASVHLTLEGAINTLRGNIEDQMVVVDDSGESARLSSILERLTELENIMVKAG